MLQIKFQANVQSGSEVDFLIYFYAFQWFENKSPWPGAILNPGTVISTNLVKNH